MDRKTDRLPKSVRLPATLFVRQDGDAVVLEPVKPNAWPEGFFDSAHVTPPPLSVQRKVNCRQ